MKSWIRVTSAFIANADPKGLFWRAKCGICKIHARNAYLIAPETLRVSA
jgi:hypothetical protein